MRFLARKRFYQRIETLLFGEGQNPARILGWRLQRAQTVALLRPTPKSEISALPEKEGGGARRVFPYLFCLTALAALLLAGCAGEEEGALLGYVEGDFRYLGPRDPGRVTTVAVAEGVRVEEGDPLFTVDADRAQAAVAEAEAGVQAARSRLEDLLAGGREEEIEAAQERVQSARAELALAQEEYARVETLVERDAAPQRQLDEAQRALNVARARVDELEAGLRLTRLPARENAVQAARDEAAAAEARLAAAREQLADRSVTAPAGGVVQTLIRRPGEFAGAGQPVLSLLPDEARRVVFFVAEEELAGVALGETVSVACDGCGDLRARVDFISSEAEFTPPVIFSEDEREKLVYRVEASPAEPAALKPGQPVRVRFP